MQQSYSGTLASTSIKGLTPPLLYRRLLKLYLTKFQTDHATIIKAWKQTKYEFYHFRNVKDTAEITALLERGENIRRSIQGGIIPVMKDPKTGREYLKYDKATLKETDNHVDPVTAEEFLRLHADKFQSEEELFEIRDKLVAAGRWKGPLEFSKDDLHSFRIKRKRKRKVKCTDPDEPLEGEKEKVSESGQAKNHSSGDGQPTTA